MFLEQREIEKGPFSKRILYIGIQIYSQRFGRELKGDCQ